MHKWYVYNYLIIILLYNCLRNVTCSDYVPVYIWDKHINDRLPALNLISNGEFRKIIQSKLQNKPSKVLVFVEDVLNNEDILYDAQSKNVFEKISNVVYYVNVEQPVTVFNNLTDTNVEEITWNDVKDKELIGSKIYIIHFGSDRNEGAKHATSIYTVYKNVTRNDNNVLLLYTGRTSSRPQEDEHRICLRNLLEHETTNLKTIIKHKPRFMSQRNKHIKVKTNKTSSFINATRIYMHLAENGRVTVNENTYPLSTCRPYVGVIVNRTMELGLCSNGDQMLTMRFRSKTGYWHIDQMRVIAGGQTYEFPVKIWAPDGMSYHCSSGMYTDTNRTVAVELIGYQVEAFFNRISNNFDSSIDCLGLFTPAIMSGIIITFVLASIMTYGIILIMDIKSNDKFDDPLKKQITIIVSK